MANRYWVYPSPANRQWGSTNEGTWATTSGGAGGASVPTAADDVFFDANSGPAGQIVTFFNPVCRSLNTTGFLGSFASSGSTLSISGNLVLTKNIPSPALSVRFLGTGSTFSINAGTNLTSHNVQIGNGSAVSDYSLAADLSSLTFVLKASSTFSTANFNINLSTSIGTETGSSFSPGTSTINCAMLNIVSGTWTAATNSTINLAATNGLSNSGNSLGTVNVNPVATPCNIVGTASYVNLTLNYPNAIMTTSISGTLTVSGTFTVNGTSSYPRIQNGTVNAANVNLNNAIFSNFTGGGAATWTGTNIGAFGAGNSNNITFSDPLTVICTNSGEWFDTATWDLRVPLPQDYTIVKTIGSNITLSNSLGSIYIKALEFQNVSGGTINCQSLGNINVMDGGFIVQPGVTIGNNKPSFFFSSLNNSGSYTISSAFAGTSAGVMRIWNTSATYTIVGDLSLTSSITHLSGNLILADNASVSMSSYSTSGSIARTLTLGSNSNLTLSSTSTPWDITGTNFTFDSGTSTINLTGSSGAIVFYGANKTYYNLVIGGLFSSINLMGSNTFNRLSSNRTLEYALYFEGNTTNTFENFEISGSSGKLVTIDGRTSGSPSSFNLVKTGASVVSCNFLTILNSKATPATNTWYAGQNSTLSGTTGWIAANAPGGLIPASLFFGSFF